MTTYTTNTSHTRNFVSVNGLSLPQLNRVGCVTAQTSPNDQLGENGGSVVEVGDFNQGSTPERREQASLSQRPTETLGRQDEIPTSNRINETNENENLSTQNTQREPNQRRPKRIKKNTKAHLKIASLNMRGAGVNIPLHPNNKWNAINFLMRDKKIGIIALQETHSTLR